jgi:hypothetical protein
MDLVSNDMKTTLHEINVKAQAILARELDPLEYVQFFHQYELRQGDYTRDREKITDNPSIDQIISEIQTNRSNNPS